MELADSVLKKQTSRFIYSHNGLLFIGLDGKVAIWDLENMEQELGNQF